MISAAADSTGVNVTREDKRTADAGRRDTRQVPDLVSLDEIQQAAGRLAGVAVRTPLVRYPGLTPELLVKPESLQATGSFKIRGAYAAISALPAGKRRRGVVAHSSGNHGYAVAYAAALLGAPAAVVVPRNAPPVKTEAIAACGAELITVEPTMAARLAGAQEVVSSRGYELIPPFDDARVIAGQGTIGLEIVADCPDVKLVAVPVSGGGLISGIAAAIKALRPEAKIVGVEPEFAADARESLRTGEPVAWPPEAVGRTVADALRVERVSALTFAHMRELVDEIVTVSDEQIMMAVGRLALQARLVAEPGGAAAVAACLFLGNAGVLGNAGPRVAVLSGGNVAPALLRQALA